MPLFDDPKALCELPICYTSRSVGRQEGVVELVTYTGVPVRCRDKVLDLNRASDAGHQVPDTYSRIFLTFLFFFLMGEIHLQNGFPIMGHLCCITVWLANLYIPRGNWATDTNATPPPLNSGALVQFWQVWDKPEELPWGAAGVGSHLEPDTSGVQESSSPITWQQEGKELRLHSKWTDAQRNERQRWLVPQKAA